MKEILAQLNERLTSTVKHWRIGNDWMGLQDFIQSLQFLEKMKEIPSPVVSKLHPICKELEQLIQNQDIIGITDVLQFKLIPIIAEWEKEGWNHVHG